MEGFSASGRAAVGCAAKKKRSGTSRRPRPDIQTLSHACAFLPQSKQSISSSSNEGNRNFRDAVFGSDGLGVENKLKLKLKFGGVTHTIQTNSTSEYAPQHRQKQDKHSDYSYPSDKGKGNGERRKDFSKSGYSFGKGHSSRGKISGDSVYMNETYDSVRKSKRVPKRRALDVGFDGDGNDDDDELRYLGRLGAPKVGAGYDDAGHGGIGREWGLYDDKDYTEEEEDDEPVSDDEPGSRRKKLEKGPLDSYVDGRNESTPTTRNRALQSGKDILSGPGAGLEFPNGLPPAPSKKQKEKLSEVEQQLKKAEAAQRRRMQSEKAAREAEAEAIRKILGQDSGRKKKEDKMKKQRDELAQGKGKSDTLATNSVRWVFGPTGTIVIFSEDIGLPNIFNPVPCSYPPPREKCAGPNCTNAYKYRDSKSKLPLCSLQCYKAIHGKMHPLIAC